MLNGPALEDEQRAVLRAVAQDEVERAVLFARTMRTRAELARLWAGEPEGDAEIELAGTARIGQVRAARQLDDAQRLVHLLTGTLALLEAGVMYVPVAELLLSTTRMCPEAVQTEVERRVLTRIATANTTDARRLLEQVIPEVEADLDPDLTRQRLENARRNRGVWVTSLPDGMCQVGASLDVLTGRRWALDFEEIVRAQRVLDRRDGVVRTQAQRRADVFAQLPSRLIAVLQAVQQGRVQELLDLATADPAAAASIQELAAATADLQSDPTGPSAALIELPGGQPAEGNPDVVVPGLEDGASVDELVRAHESDVPEVGPQATGGWDDWPWEQTESEPCPGSPARMSATSDAATEPADGPPPAEAVPAAAPAGARPPGAPPPRGAADIPESPPPWDVQELAIACLRMSVRDPRVIDVHIPMTTLLELDNRTGWVEGVGPVPTLLTRLLLPVAGLRRVYVDPRHGVPLGVDAHVDPAVQPASRSAVQQAIQPAVQTVTLTRPSPSSPRAEAADIAGRTRLLGLLGPAVLTHRAADQHDPSGSLQRLIQLRDQRCTGIGCSRQASACDLDHEQAYPQGPTAEWNLSSKSRRCHRAKHGGWTTERADDGSTTWTSRLGHSYVRPGVWEAPTEVPHDLELPPAATTALETDEPWLLELPLWPASQP